MLKTQINRYSALPLYKQLMANILEAVTVGAINAGDLLPSLHDHSSALDISKNTVERAYRELKQAGILGSFKGKGYYLRKVERADVQLSYQALTEELA